MTACVLWARFGPYHIARLAAAHGYFASRGDAIVGLEVAGDDATYAWDTEGESPFPRTCAFPDRTVEAIPNAEMARGITEALDRLDPSAVAFASYSTPDALAALAWCRRKRRTAVMMFDSRAEDAPRSVPREALKRALVSGVDAALVAGTQSRAYARALGVHETYAPLDVVDNASFASGAERPRPDLAPVGPYFLASGRFVGRKNLSALLRAYAAYRTQSDAPWPLVLLGDGPEREPLAALAGEGVTFAGFQQRDALPAFYGHAGAFVHPATQDQWGLVVNEAMAAGLPLLISTGAGCAPDLVENGENGWTFSPEAEDDLAALLARTTALAPEVRQRLGQRSREIVASFRPEDFAEGLWRACLTPPKRAFPFRCRLALAALARRDPRACHAIPD